MIDNEKRNSHVLLLVINECIQSHGSYSGQKCVVKVQNDFSLAYHFSGQDERYLWEQESSFPDSTIMDRTLCARIFNQCISSAWPLIFDPYRQFESYLQTLTSQQESNKAEGMNKQTHSSLSIEYENVPSSCILEACELDQTYSIDVPL